MSTRAEQLVVTHTGHAIVSEDPALVLREVDGGRRGVQSRLNLVGPVSCSPMHHGLSAHK